jgi:predicted RNase H-like HicB family nuclease
MKKSQHYLKIVTWSDEDQCFIGQCPDIIGPCCHGDDEIQVYAELCQIVEEWIAILKQEGKPLPEPLFFNPTVNDPRFLQRIQSARKNISLH